MRFTVEQQFLTDTAGRRASADPAYHLVEADTVDAALHDFLTASSATLVGTVQKFPGFHAVATARSGEAVFTVQLLPGSDIYRTRARR